MNNRDEQDLEENISEGEICIQEFFYEQDIIAEYNKKIDFLKGDNKSYRMADFYIPCYDLYVEFLGLWNVSEEQKTRYREKKNIYIKNNIACIYFYPENLGNLKYTFYYRAMKELKDRGKKKHLFKLRVEMVYKKSKFLMVFLGLILGLIIGTIRDYDIDPKSFSWLCILLTIMLFGLGILYWRYRMLVTKKFHKEYNYNS
jgi:hypothetical protein